MELTTTPAEARAASRTPVIVEVHNRSNLTVDATLRVRFGWESQVIPWGSILLAPGERSAHSVLKMMTSQTGDFPVTLQLQGNATNATAPAEGVQACSPVVRNIVVIPKPEPIKAFINAEPTNGTMPLAVTFSADVAGGIPPFEMQWKFGDGGKSNQTTITYVYSQGGIFQAQLSVSDVVSQEDVDRIQIVVLTSAPGGSAKDSEAPSLLGPCVFVLMLLVAARRRSTSRLR